MIIIPLRRSYFRRWRKWYGLTVAEVAEQIGVLETVVTAIESGRMPYTHSFLASFAAIVGADPWNVLNRPPLRPLAEQLPG